MSRTRRPLKVPPQPERSAVVASPQPVCAVCGGPRDPRKREACSDRCRAALSRSRRDTVQRVRDERLRELLETALRVLERSCEASSGGGPCNGERATSGDSQTRS